MTRHTPSGPVTTSRRGSFWVGVEDRVDGPLGTVIRGPMYVEWEAPAELEPEQGGRVWVLVHGGGGQGTDYLTTPDGRLGWSRLLVQQGHTVYVVDRPGHGRSPHHPDILGPMGPQVSAEVLKPIFVPASDEGESNPWAALHTQWPGGREPGDPIYDQWLAPSGPMLASRADMHALEEARLAELLDRVGPAVLVTHSAAGPGTLLAADARPDQVAALIAIEIVQEDPPRRLVNLSRFPIAVVTGEASMFRAFDDDLVARLEQGGGTVDRIQLADHGVHGNAHGIMLERNSAEALAVLTRWAGARVKAC
jgi:pimeloyl-ACP methyl ester carboxylesterase